MNLKVKHKFTSPFESWVTILLISSFEDTYFRYFSEVEVFPEGCECFLRRSWNRLHLPNYWTCLKTDEIQIIRKFDDGNFRGSTISNTNYSLSSCGLHNLKLKISMQHHSSRVLIVIKNYKKVSSYFPDKERRTFYTEKKKSLDFHCSHLLRFNYFLK